jgi:predicted lipoprotein with Yx(FWY)xxD motif
MSQLSKLVFAAVLSLSFAGCATTQSASAPAMMADGVMVNSAGMTLYTFDKDTANSGKSACNGPCAALWPPVAATGNESGDYSAVTRDDGSKQLAYKGKPVYLFAKDQKPGDKTGDGVKDVWHVIK